MDQLTELVDNVLDEKQMLKDNIGRCIHQKKEMNTQIIEAQRFLQQLGTNIQNGEQVVMNAKLALEKLMTAADEKQKEIDSHKAKLHALKTKYGQNAGNKTSIVCKFGTNCRYYMARKEWKKAGCQDPQPQKCAFIHKNDYNQACKFGAGCKHRTTCKYNH